MATRQRLALNISAGLIAMLMPGTLCARLQPDEQVYAVPLAGGACLNVLIARPKYARATIVMLPGGSGDIGLTRDGDIHHDDNFVVRTRRLWVARGYAVVIPDTVSKANLRGWRSSPQYGHIVGKLIEFAHAQVSGPIFLLGTSQGSIAAVNGGARAARGTVAGIVLTESVSVLGGSHETVFDANPQDVRVPVLIVANRDDRCAVAPPEMASKIAAAMTGSPEVKVLRVSGGTTHSSTDCGSLTPHGYFGIETSVVDVISQWLNAPKAG